MGRTTYRSMNENSLSVLVTQTSKAEEHMFLAALNKEGQLEAARRMVKAVIKGKAGGNILFPNGLMMSKFSIQRDDLKVKTQIEFWVNDKRVSKSYTVRDFHRV